MHCHSTARMIILCAVTFLAGWNVAYSATRKTGEVTYTIEFMSSFVDCDNFKNEKLDMTDIKIQYESSKSNFLNGTVTVKEDLGEEGITEVSVSSYKETGLGREFFYTMSGDFCSHLADYDMPWTQLFDILKSTNCPIKAGTYEIDRLKFNLDFAKSVMKHEFVGDYYLVAALQRAARARPLPALAERVSCHAIQLAVIEAKLDD